MGTKQDLRAGIDQALDQLEQLADEVRVKLHLAGMDTVDTWEKKLEPRLADARRHAKEATAASKAAIEDAIAAIREFSSKVI